MKLKVAIAFKYLFSKGKQSVVNKITGIAMLASGIGAMALVIVLSAFNGIDGLVKDLYNQFDSSIAITPSEGKHLTISEFPESEVLQLIGSTRKKASYTFTETVLLKHRDNQTTAKIKGVEPSFNQLNNIDSLMYDGRWNIADNNLVLGYGVAENSGVYLNNEFATVLIYAPKPNASAIDLANAFTSKPFTPKGIFIVNPEYDYSMVFANISSVQELFNQPNKATAFEISLPLNQDLQEAKKAISNLVGPKYSVTTRNEQNELYYKTSNSEKWMIFFILSFIVFIAAFNSLAAVSMLILDKKQDAFVLSSMGLTSNDLQQVYTLNGILISTIGGAVGIVLGSAVILIQQYFGIVPMYGVIVDYYPVILKITDVFLIFIVIVGIGAITSFIPARIMVK